MTAAREGYWCRQLRIGNEEQLIRAMQSSYTLPRIIHGLGKNAHWYATPLSTGMAYLLKYNVRNFATTELDPTLLATCTDNLHNICIQQYANAKYTERSNIFLYIGIRATVYFLT